MVFSSYHPLDVRVNCSYPESEQNLSKSKISVNHYVAQRDAPDNAGGEALPGAEAHHGALNPWPILLPLTARNLSIGETQIYEGEYPDFGVRVWRWEK